ncbi:MAG: hypothetical protein WCL42_06470, partial [Chlorobiaceae bacterium]
MPETSWRTSHFTESIIRRMTCVANDCAAINLSQGFPDEYSGFDAPSCSTIYLDKVRCFSSKSAI